MGPWPQADQPVKASELRGSCQLDTCYPSSNTSSSIGGCGVGPRCSFCGTFTGPFSQIEGLFTVLICILCLEVRQAQPGTLLGVHDPGQPWEQWGCPIGGCGRWFLGPWDLEGHTEAEHPDWTATYELLRPYPNQRQRVVYRRGDGHRRADPTGLWWPVAEVFDA